MGRRPPPALAVPAAAAVVFLLTPLLGVLARAPWQSLAARLESPDVRQALGLSLLVSGWALAIALLLGVPLAWVLARVAFPGRALVRSLVMLPMVLPPTVAGVALLLGFGRRGLLGPLLEDRLGVVLPFSTPGAVVAAAFVSMPFLVISLEGAFTQLRPGYEETAASLGASPLRVFRTVTLPMAGPGLAAGAALCWARALGEFGATITFAGNLPGVTQTLPLQVYLLLQDDPDGATAVSLLLLVIAAAVLVALRGRWTPGGRRSTGPRRAEADSGAGAGANAGAEHGSDQGADAGNAGAGNAEDGDERKDEYAYEDVDEHKREHDRRHQRDREHKHKDADGNDAGNGSGPPGTSGDAGAYGLPDGSVSGAERATAAAGAAAPAAGPTASGAPASGAPASGGPNAGAPPAEPTAAGPLLAGPPPARPPSAEAPSARPPAVGPPAAEPPAAGPPPAEPPSAEAPSAAPPAAAPLSASVTGAVEAVLDAPAGTTIAVVGPNGAGKTTLLRALLGLTPRARAVRLTLGGQDVAAAPPHRRGVAWVPQDGALFPHLTALGNAAYGLRAQGVPRARARAEAQAWLDRLGVGRLAHRRPGHVSGGQAQRVALARALAARPRLLLLDEPLAALDATTRARVRHTLRAHLAAFPGVCLLVTHDPVEAVSLADRVLVLHDGRAVQYAAPAEVARRPRSPWVARMLGRNAWPGTSRPGGLELPGGARLVAAEPLARDGVPALAVVAPEAVSLHRDRPSGSPRNVWQGTVRELTAHGGRLRVLVGGVRGAPDTVAEVTPAAAADLGLAEGAGVWVSIKATELTLVAL